MRQEPRAGAPVVHGSERREATPKPSISQQPAPWVPELVDILVEQHRRCASRFAHVGLYERLQRARRRPAA